MESLLPKRLATLGHPQRLAVFRLLMRRYPEALPAGEIAAVLGAKHSTLSAYLAALTQVGLVSQERSGTSLRYTIRLDAVRETFGDLLYDCCRGRPDLCAAPDPAMHSPRRKATVLFLCTGNSARSIFAEAILRNEACDRFEAFSAGTHPAAAPNPVALKVLAAEGHDISRLRTKSVAKYQAADAPRFDFVFTVCDHAANEDCPAWPGSPIAAHWSVPDPSLAEGGPMQKILAFQKTYEAMRTRIRAFTALPTEALDPVALQQAVDDIGRTRKDLVR